MIKFRSIVIFTLILSTVVLSGCASKGETYKFYSGENRTADKVATIIPFHEITMLPLERTDVYIIEIDGILTEKYNLSIPTYEILPGEHKLKLGFLLIRGGSTVRGVDPAYMVFKAEAGHTYAAKGNFPKTISEGQSVISFWLEDINTKEVVAGTKKTNMNAFGESYKPSLPRVVPGTATDSELQSDITQQFL